MANTHKLSEGALQVIMKGGDYNQPIMQVLGSKKINAGGSDKERYRILLSDGKNTISYAMLTTQVNDRASSKGVPDFSIIKVERYITSVINNSGKADNRVLLILDMQLLISGDEVGERIGNPTPLIDTISNEQESSSGTGNSGYQTKSTSNPPPAKLAKMNGAGCSSNGSDISGHLTHPISSLSPYHNRWVIKVRVTNKSSIRTWSNSRGEGKLFSVDLVDESGEIRLTGFKDAVDKFYDYIQLDKVYYISRCLLKPANKQYSSLKNDYEMTMTPDTIIQESLDDEVSTIPKTKYDFVPIDKIAKMEPGTLIDVIGVVKTVGDIQTFQARTTGRELKKKEVILVDQTNTAITLTLWGSEAEEFKGNNNAIVAVKGARLSEFGGGKNVSTVSSSLMKVNPDLEECYRLRGWYDSEGSHLDPVNISARSGVGSLSAPWMSFKEVQDQGLGNGERGDYYQVKGTILLMRAENCIYKACPTEECNKKVVDLENGMYRCEKCNREYPNFKYRLLASMNVGDWSGNQWINMFSSEVEKVLGLTAQGVGEQSEENPEALSDIIENVNFKQFIMKCRAKMETYNDEARLKTVCVKVDPVNYEEHNAYLIERIQQYLA